MKRPNIVVDGSVHRLRGDASYLLRFSLLGKDLSECEGRKSSFVPKSCHMPIGRAGSSLIPWYKAEAWARSSELKNCATIPRIYAPVAHFHATLADLTPGSS
jgi:hypothetical protein